jgi:hypothetical protein
MVQGASGNARDRVNREGHMRQRTMTAAVTAAVAAVVAVVAVPGFAHAQASQVAATATVANYSAITGTGDLAFGELSRTVDNIVNATGAAAALRTVSYNHNIRVTFANVPTHLTANAGTLQLPVSLNCAARIGTETWSTPVPCSGAQLDLDVGTALTSATLGFGGSITAAHTADAVAASYRGTLDIVITAR